MRVEIRSGLIGLAKKYSKDEFGLFTAELGWQDWMRDYSSEPDNDYIMSEGELSELESDLKEIFNEAQIRTLAELNAGDVVTDGKDFAVVKTDINESKYYANINSDDTRCDYFLAIEVSDMYEDYLN